MNPGRQDLGFQGPDGLFADEMRTLGSYSAWASSAPYSRYPWMQGKGRNKYHDLRLEVARRWTRDVTVLAGQLILLEFHPWHSIGVKATMAPDPGIIRRFVWDPVADTAVPLVFAFGADWRRTAEALKLPEHPLTVPSRPAAAKYAVTSCRAVNS